MLLFEEFTNRGYHIISSTPKVYCKSIEDISAALEIICVSKICPQTKTINLIYQNFHKHVHLGKINIYPIASNSQLANVFAKPLSQNTSVVIQKHIWD